MRFLLLVWCDAQTGSVSQKYIFIFIYNRMHSGANRRGEIVPARMSGAASARLARFIQPRESRNRLPAPLFRPEFMQTNLFTRSLVY